jgi:DNA-binding NarL/FixJ family response regulator
MLSVNGKDDMPAMGSRRPVLMATHDDTLWARWREIETAGWLPARATGLAEIENWKHHGRALVVLDISLPKLPPWNDSGWAAMTSGLTLLAASTHPSDAEATRIIGAGFTGYVHAYAPLTVMSSALATVAVGGMWLGRSLITRMLRQIDERLPAQGHWATGLTARETEVAERAAKGESNQEIADALQISERTVRAHISAVFDKLEVSDRLKLALKVHGVQ